jgi:hypothetical protein
MSKDEEFPQDITINEKALCIFHSNLSGRHIQLPAGCIVDSIHLVFTDEARYPIGVCTQGGPSIYGHEDVVITDNCDQEYLIKLDGGMKCYELVCDTTLKPLSALELQLKSAYIHHVIDAWWWTQDVGELFREIETGKEIIKAAGQIEADSELAISFIQVGKDRTARDFLSKLDDDLTKAGAKFDIVDTVTMDDLDDKPLEEVLFNAIMD